ncbi:MAG TPA: MFS transporter, partial [Candidatus Dormibacteraeota bacterium]|nr:MFS transporter [Candidatus Dormibacteraeota bacterium]
ARLSLGTLLGRTANQLTEVGIVLFVLERFHSPALAGLVVFVLIFPGLLVSPLAGALLDRHGRVRLIILDQIVAAAGLAAIVLLARLGRLTPTTMLPLVAMTSLTGMFSAGGIRSLFPILLPRPMWGRGNAVDSTGFTITTIVGPGLAGGLVAALGADTELLACSAVFALAAVAFAGLREPPPRGDQPALLRSAWEALVYVVRNATLRNTAIALSVFNLGSGIWTVGLPVLVLSRLHGGPNEVGLLFSLSGVAGVVSGLIFGRFYREGIEPAAIALGMALIGASLLILAFAPGVALVALASVLSGLAIGPIDVSFFSLRQRRTHTASLGRAMAVSMSLNFAGAPLGSALGGPILHRSITGAFLVATALALAGALLAWVLIPRRDDPGLT